MSKVFGFIAPDSTNELINFIARATDKDEPLLSVVGKMLYFDTNIEGRVYRAVGTVTEMRTSNNSFNAAIKTVISKDEHQITTSAGRDLRESRFNIQAVFMRNGENQPWEQAAAFLPTSPSTQTNVYLVDDETVRELTANMLFPSVGNFRGLNTPLPINTPDFGGGRGAYHSGVVGKSGSGKTSGYTFVLSTYMRHEQHAIVVVDPQGQWSNENGFIFSPQALARGLGREVSLIRISEEVRLPKSAELISRIALNRKAWARMRRMGSENQEVFSHEVAERLVRNDRFDDEPREQLTAAFKSIGSSKTTLRRIYASDDSREQFARFLHDLVGETPDWVDTDAENYEELTKEDEEDIERAWVSILKVFTPLLNLFASKNLEGNKRHALSGTGSILTDIFQVRTAHSKPAPYVVIDMSPDIKNNARVALNKQDDMSNMAAMMDNESVKALILQVLFEEIKKASESAFAGGGGLLNTQIIFDEAWRYAPEGKAELEIEELAEMLEGFAKDTRKFGIGWTYILQQPTDLRKGIWNQLTYIYAAYGLVGNDVRMMEERYSDKAQTAIYNGFISPASTNQYPLMIVGSISPLIFTNAPTFLDMFTSAEQFVNANNEWITQITTKRSLARITPAIVDPSTRTPGSMRRANSSGEDKVITKEYKVGKTYSTSEPQTEPKPVTLDKPRERDEYDGPF